MPEMLDWIDVLNEQATWTSGEDTVRWLSGILNRRVSPTPSAVEHFQETLNLMRRQLSALHFGEEPDLASIDMQLGNLRLELSSPGQRPGGVLLPSFRARLEGASDDDLIACIGQTLLLEFARFLGEQLDSPQTAKIARCEGLYREAGANRISPCPDFPADIELKWRREIPALVEAGLDSSPDLLRCADFFVARARGKFCSDECRFRTFQIAKQLADPGYLAEKQKRYRQRRK